MKNWQFSAAVKNRLCARNFKADFDKIFKFFKHFYKKQVYSLEIEAIFAKMAKMALFDFSRTRNYARKGDFLRMKKIFKF